MKLNGFRTGLIFGLLSDVLFFLFFMAMPLVAPLDNIDTQTLETLNGLSGNESAFAYYFLGFLVVQPVLSGLVGKWLLKTKD